MDCLCFLTDHQCYSLSIFSSALYSGEILWCGRREVGAGETFTALTVKTEICCLCRVRADFHVSRSKEEELFFLVIKERGKHGQSYFNSAAGPSLIPHIDFICPCLLFQFCTKDIYALCWAPLSVTSGLNG